MTTNAVPQFQIPNDLPVVAERGIEGCTRRDDQRGTKSDFEFLVLCFVLTAVIFGLIQRLLRNCGQTLRMALCAPVAFPVGAIVAV